jgi:hypothetical protein
MPAELARRFFTSHGPATVKDLAWWSGLTVTESRAGLEAAQRGLERETFDGEDFWFAPAASKRQRGPRAARLLPAYDESLIAYRDSRAFFKPYAKQLTRDHGQVVVVNGRALGSWRRVVSGQRLVIEVTRFAPLTAAETRAIEQAVERYGRFHEVEAGASYRG